MRRPSAFGFKRERFAGSRVGQLAAIANTRRAVEGIASTSAATGAPTNEQTHQSTVHTTNATYMPSMTESPWAKLTMFIMPQISVRPDENNA